MAPLINAIVCELNLFEAYFLLTCQLNKKDKEKEQTVYLCKVCYILFPLSMNIAVTPMGGGGGGLSLAQEAHTHTHTHTHKAWALQGIYIQVLGAAILLKTY